MTIHDSPAAAASRQPHTHHNQHHSSSNRTAATPSSASSNNSGATPTSQASSSVRKGPRGYTGPTTQEGKPHGLGRQEYRDGSVYVGPFINGVREGPGGQFIFSNGDTYVGQFYKGDKHGRGEYRWCDGSFYNGRWDRDKRCGDNEELTIAPLAGAALRDHFIFSFYSRFPRVADLLETLLGSELQYRGGFLDDAVHGNGEMIFTCGANFEGSFEQGMEHGHCTLHIANGVRIEGEWFEGEVQTLVRVFCDSVFPREGKAASMMVDADVKDVIAVVYSIRGMAPGDGRSGSSNLPSPQRFGEAFTRSRQLAAQAAAEGVFGRPSREDPLADNNNNNNDNDQQQQDHEVNSRALIDPNQIPRSSSGPSFAQNNQNTQTSFDSGDASSHPISRASRANLAAAVSRMNNNNGANNNNNNNNNNSDGPMPSPISRAGQYQLQEGLMNMRHPVPISRAGKDGLERAVAKMGDQGAWSVGGGLVEWVEPVDTCNHKNVNTNLAWWRNHESRSRRRLNMRNYGPNGEMTMMGGDDRSSNNNNNSHNTSQNLAGSNLASPVSWNSVGNNSSNNNVDRRFSQGNNSNNHNNSILSQHQSPDNNQNNNSRRPNADAEVEAVISDPKNAEELMMLKDMPTRADVIQRIIDSAASKRKLVRCGIAVSLADCEVCSAFTNRVWWYLRTKMKDPNHDEPPEKIPAEERRVVRVLDVAPGGVGEQWGLTRGDAVVSYCGFPAWEHTVLRKKSVKPGDLVSITVVRRTFDGDVEHANDFQPTNEPPTRMEEFATTERVIEKSAVVGCNLSKESWDLLKSIPPSIKSSASWMQDASWADLRTLLKKVRAINVSARPEAWTTNNNNELGSGDGSSSMKRRSGGGAGASTTKKERSSNEPQYTDSIMVRPS